MGAAVLGGCGSSGSGSSSATQSSTTQSTTSASTKPLGPPPDKETIQQAEQRIAKTASSGDCNVVNKLNPISRPGFNTDTRCKVLQLASAKPTGAAQYGDGGVIEYKLNGGTLGMLLVRDSDGLFHVTYLDTRLPEPTVGTKLAPQFDPTAADAVNALRDHDCSAFMKVAFVEFGPGAGDKNQVCTYAQSSPLATLLKDDPQAKPKLMGGNGTFAFYGLSLPGSFWTLILAKETSKDRVPEGGQPLPADAPEYGYLDAFRTNPPAPAGSGGSS